MQPAGWPSGAEPLRQAKGPDYMARESGLSKRRGNAYVRPAAEKAVKAAMCLFLAPTVFALVSYAICFSWHYEAPAGAWLLTAVCCLPSFIWYRIDKRERALAGGPTSAWSGFSSFTFAFAVLAGAIFGQWTYLKYSQPALFLNSLKTYKEVDPFSGISGERLMDAGLVHFTLGSRVVTDMAMSFTDSDVYCVAPISTPQGIPTQGGQGTNYDLWAVGVNCCRSSASDQFTCGDVEDVDARAGVRFADESRRPYFHLAVQQAEAAYNIQSRHPIFFTWVKDPELQQKMLYQTASGLWTMALSLYTTVNTFALIIFAVIFQGKDSHIRMVLED